MTARLFTMLLGLGVTATAAGQSLDPAGTIPSEAEVSFTAIARDGRQLAAACGDRKLRVFSLPAGRLAHTLDLGGMGIGVLAYSRDGRRLAAGGGRGAVRVFDATSGAVVQELPPAATGIDALALSPDGRLLAVAPSDLPAQLWDIAQRRQVAELKSSFAGSGALAFSPDGKLLACANSDTTVRVFDAATGRLRSSFEELEPFALDFTPDSRILVVGGADKLLVAIDPETGKAVHRLGRQRDPIGGLGVLVDGRTVVAASFNADNMNQTRAILAWNMATGALKTLAPGANFNGAGAVADGRLLLTSFEGGALKLWAFR